MALPPKVYQFLVGLFASLGSVLFGYDLGVIAQVITSTAFEGEFRGNKDTKTWANETGAVVSVFTGGCFFGAFAAGLMADKLGRRLTILVGALVFCLGGALQTGAQALSYLYAGRSIAGLGVGILVMIIPIYQAELTHPSIRGRVTALVQFMLGIGALVATWTGYGATIHFGPTQQIQWRLPLAIQIVPAAILAALIMIFPESPRWLIDHGKAEQGLRTLAKLHAHGDESDPWVQAEFQQIQDAITFDHEHEASSWLEVFKDISCFRRLLIACGLQASVQMTGVSCIQYYSVIIFKQIGIDAADTLKYQGISSVLALFGQFLCIMLIDRFGRRWTIILGNAANCICFVIATIMLAMYPPGTTSNHAASWAFIIVTWLYNFSFSSTCGPLSWIIPAEIFDTKTRAKGVAIATMTSFAFNTMIGQVSGLGMATAGWKFYLLFVVCNATNAIYFYCFLPETANRPLEEMNHLFTHAPYFVPGMDKRDWRPGTDLQHRVEAIEAKNGSISHTEVKV